MPRRTSVVMQTTGVTLHLERQSTHQGVVMTLDNRATGYSKEVLADFEKAHEQWGKLLHEAADQLHALAPQLVERDDRGPRIPIESELEEDNDIELVGGRFRADGTREPWSIR